MSRLFRLIGAVRRDPAVTAWLDERTDDLGDIARQWFAVLRNCGDDVCELMHDGAATACIEDCAFAYVNVFTAHVNVGFFLGADLDDPNALLQGSGRFMRHVKLGPKYGVDPAALERLVDVAYEDMKARVAATPHA